MTDHDPGNAAAGADGGAADERDALLSRLRVIEDQPLAARAAAYGQLHDELQAALEDGDQAPGR
ncbi:MAG: hypothetical protein ACSLE3_15195 [Microbacteriaceae bacterium]